MNVIPLDDEISLTAVNPSPLFFRIEALARKIGGRVTGETIDEAVRLINRDILLRELQAACLVQGSHRRERQLLVDLTNLRRERQDELQARHQQRNEELEHDHRLEREEYSLAQSRAMKALHTLFWMTIYGNSMFVGVLDHTTNRNIVAVIHALMVLPFFACFGSWMVLDNRLEDCQNGPETKLVRKKFETTTQFIWLFQAMCLTVVCVARILQCVLQLQNDGTFHLVVPSDVRYSSLPRFYSGMCVTVACVAAWTIHK